MMQESRRDEQFQVRHCEEGQEAGGDGREVEEFGRRWLGKKVDAQTSLSSIGHSVASTLVQSSEIP